MWVYFRAYFCLHVRRQASLHIRWPLVDHFGSNVQNRDHKSLAQVSVSWQAGNWMNFETLEIFKVSPGFVQLRPCTLCTTPWYLQNGWRYLSLEVCKPTGTIDTNSFMSQIHHYLSSQYRLFQKSRCFDLFCGIMASKVEFYTDKECTTLRILHFVIWLGIIATMHACRNQSGVLRKRILL